ncbi:ribbon-helix-helix protein, CopG family [Burkholderia thailandensis]|nr:ribbon-helix-helix protein, CopG family [Burkholderia thailandensis]
MTTPLRQQLRERSKQLDLPMGELIRQAVAAYLERARTTPPRHNERREA